MLITDCIPEVFVAPVVSPLNLLPDAIGQSLQEAMIWAPADAQIGSSFVAFRKKFELAEIPRQSNLHLFADVRYVLWINGHYVLRGPARFEPTGPEYDSMEIAPFLRSGSNEIVLLVMGNISNGRMRLHPPCLTLRLDVDGRTALITDESWKWSDHTRYRNPFVDWGNVGDRIDARLEDGDWTQPGYNDSAWSRAVKVDGTLWGPLTARRTPLLRETKVAPSLVDGQKLPRTLEANQKLDFSTDKLIQAYTVLELEADEGTEISLDYANIDYIARPGRQTYISSDTHGFFGGSITVKVGRVTVHDFQLVECLYPFDVAGSFKSNDEMLNRLWALCARSAQVFSEDTYVDCADRERAEWMDSNQPGFDITRTALAGKSDDGTVVYADARLLGAMLRRTALSVQGEGWVKAHAVSDRFDIHAKMEDRSCDWVEAARRYYESTADKTIIREIWPVIVRQMNYFLERRTERGLVLGRDWEVWGNPIGYVTCEGAGLNAFVYRALVDAAYLGEVVGELQHATRFFEASRELHVAFNAILWDEKRGAYSAGYTEDYEKSKGGRHIEVSIEGNLIESTMIAALFALDQGLVPPYRRARVTAYLLANRDDIGTIMPYFYLFNQLYRLDTAEFDVEVLQTLRERWQGMVDSLWQTTWEDFHGHARAHIYGMFPGYHLSAYALGVRLDGPVWNKRILVEPHLGDLTLAEGTVVTEFGPVAVSWKMESKTLKFDVEIPKGVQATLRIPQIGLSAILTLNGEVGVGRLDGRYLVIEVGSGYHQGQVNSILNPTRNGAEAMLKLTEY